MKVKYLNRDGNGIDLNREIQANCGNNPDPAMVEFLSQPEIEMEFKTISSAPEFRYWGIFVRADLQS